MLEQKPSNGEANGQATDQPRYPGTNASLGTNPNPPTSDNGVTSTELTRETCGNCGHPWSHHDATSTLFSLQIRCSMCSCRPGFMVVSDRSARAPSMNSGSRVVSSASPSTGDQQ